MPRGSPDRAGAIVPAAPERGSCRESGRRHLRLGSGLLPYGGSAAIGIREPMALGHEIAGTSSRSASAVERLAPGTRVAVNPSHPCGGCRYCRRGLRNECLDMHFFGSAMRLPHDQGGFRQSLTVAAEQAVPIAEA